MKNKKINFLDLGLKGYEETWDFQKEILSKILTIKKENKTLKLKKKTPNYVLFVEHPSTYTLGRNGKKEHLLLKETSLSSIKSLFITSDRGGDITYHGPGQLVIYPILDLSNFYEDLHKYLRFLEEVIIQTLSYYAIDAYQIKGKTGVWVKDNKKEASKICAIGIRVSNWISMHGLALNVNTNLDYFKHIIPCGLKEMGVTSFENELKRQIPIKEVKEKIKEQFQWLFTSL